MEFRTQQLQLQRQQRQIIQQQSIILAQQKQLAELQDIVKRHETELEIINAKLDTQLLHKHADSK